MSFCLGDLRALSVDRVQTSSRSSFQPCRRSRRPRGPPRLAHQIRSSISRLQLWDVARKCLAGQGLYRSAGRGKETPISGFQNVDFPYLATLRRRRRLFPALQGLTGRRTPSPADTHHSDANVEGTLVHIVAGTAPVFSGTRRSAGILQDALGTPPRAPSGSRGECFRHASAVMFACLAACSRAAS